MAKALARTSASFIWSVSSLLPKCVYVKSCGRSAILLREIEGEDPIRSVRPLQHLRMAKRANRIAVAGLPVLLHRAAGELVILGGTFVVLGLVDELDEVVDLLVR